MISNPAIATEEILFAPYYRTHYVIDGPQPARGDEKPDAPTT